MARNANWDKAKRQAVGIYRAASPQASINNGEPRYSGGEYRVPEGAKAIYHGKPEPVDVTGFKVRICEPFKNSSGRKVIPNDLNRKRGGSDPRTRGELLPGKAARAGTHYTARMGTATLIPRA